MLAQKKVYKDSTEERILIGQNLSTADKTLPIFLCLPVPKKIDRNNMKNDAVFKSSLTFC